jgi:hypothetical protein
MPGSPAEQLTGRGLVRSLARPGRTRPAVALRAWLTTVTAAGAVALVHQECADGRRVRDGRRRGGARRGRPGRGRRDRDAGRSRARHRVARPRVAPLRGGAAAGARALGGRASGTSPSEAGRPSRRAACWHDGVMREAKPVGFATPILRHDVDRAPHERSLETTDRSGSPGTDAGFGRPLGWRDRRTTVVRETRRSEPWRRCPAAGRPRLVCAVRRPGRVRQGGPGPGDPGCRDGRRRGARRARPRVGPAL